ncbi:MAG: NAD-dependent epimerase/dehydratase family protein [Dehalococcoidia bacterium]
MLVFVAGATGVLGRASVRELIAAGHEVRGASRSGANAAILRELGATPVSVDLFDPASAREAVAGCDAVAHLATKIPPLMKMRSRKAWVENDRIRRDVTKNLVDAALAADAKTFVVESITFVYGDGGDEWIDEDFPVKPAWTALDSTFDLEREAKRFAESGGKAVILRFGLFYGPDAQSTLDSAKLARRRMLPVIGKGQNYFSSIHHDDAARAVVAALDAPGGTYNVVEDDPVRQVEYAAAFREAIGAPKSMRMPRWLGKLFVGGPANYILQSQRISNRRFKEATGWAPSYPRVRDGFRQVAEQMAKADAN